MLMKLLLILLNAVDMIHPYLLMIIFLLSKVTILMMRISMTSLNQYSVRMQDLQRKSQFQQLVIQQCLLIKSINFTSIGIISNHGEIFLSLMNMMYVKLKIVMNADTWKRKIRRCVINMLKKKEQES